MEWGIEKRDSPDRIWSNRKLVQNCFYKILTNFNPVVSQMPLGLSYHLHPDFFNKFQIVKMRICSKRYRSKGGRIWNNRKKKKHKFPLLFSGVWSFEFSLTRQAWSHFAPGCAKIWSIFHESRYNDRVKLSHKPTEASNSGPIAWIWRHTECRPAFTYLNR